MARQRSRDGSKSNKQARLMAACSHGSTYAKCPPADVAKRFNQADKGKARLRNAVAEINRTPANNRFAKGLRSGKGK